jgi:hypothetical protein
MILTERFEGAHKFEAARQAVVDLLSAVGRSWREAKTHPTGWRACMQSY